MNTQQQAQIDASRSAEGGDKLQKQQQENQEKRRKLEEEQVRSVADQPRFADDKLQEPRQLQTQGMAAELNKEDMAVQKQLLREANEGGIVDRRGEERETTTNDDQRSFLQRLNPFTSSNNQRNDEQQQQQLERRQEDDRRQDAAGETKTDDATSGDHRSFLQRHNPFASGDKKNEHHDTQNDEQKEKHENSEQQSGGDHRSFFQRHNPLADKRVNVGEDSKKQTEEEESKHHHHHPDTTFNEWQHKQLGEPMSKKLPLQQENPKLQAERQHWYYGLTDATDSEVQGQRANAGGNTNDRETVEEKQSQPGQQSLSGITTENRYSS